MDAPPPPYVILNGTQNENPGNPPSHHINVPPYKPNKKKSVMKRLITCICCSCFCFFFFIFILSIMAFYFYIMSMPEIPVYNVENLEVKAFDLQPDFSLKTEFIVTVRAENPNDGIGFMYGENSSVHVVYSDNELCSGKLPSFHQGEKNTTLMKVDLVGKSPFGSGLQEAFAESRKNHKIPLLVKVKVPVRVVFGEVPMREFKVLVNCSLLVDNLVPNKKIGILSSNSTFDFEFLGL